MKSFLTVALLCIFAIPAWATQKAVTLSVPTMDCPVCPITVKKVLTKVQGVNQVEVNFDRRQATITFDDTKTSIDALTRATKDAGYPSVLVGHAK